MQRSLLAQLLAVGCVAASYEANAQADLVTARELARTGAVRMTPSEMASLFFPGSRVMHITPLEGDLRTLQIGADNVLTANVRLGFYGRQAGATGHGKWSLREDGVYCVRIQWPREVERWCYAGYKHQGGMYLAPESLEGVGAQSFGRFEKG